MRKVVFVAFLTIAGASQASAQDAAAGEKVFLVCKTCHQIGEGAKNGIAPVLNGIIGRKAGSVAGYSYTAANKNFARAGPIHSRIFTGTLGSYA